MIHIAGGHVEKWVLFCSWKSYFRWMIPQLLWKMYSASHPRIPLHKVYPKDELRVCRRT